MMLVEPDTGRWLNLQAHTETLNRVRCFSALKVRSPHLRHLAVATGMVEAALDLPSTCADKPRIWSHAAGSLIAEEAGAAVMDAIGQPLNFLCGRTLYENYGTVVVAKGLACWRLTDAIATACSQKREEEEQTTISLGKSVSWLTVFG